MSRRVLLLRAVLFCGLAAGLFGGALAAPLVLGHFSRILPDNYSLRAEEALRGQDWSAAEKIARERVEKVSWDMDAYYLLGRALAGAGKPGAAADVMREVQRKVLTARGREITVTGYDEGGTVRQLAGYLWQDGQYQYAGEMYRAAIDTDDTGTEDEIRKHLAVLPSDPEAAAALATVAFKLRNASALEKSLAALDAAGQSAAARGLVLKALWLEQVEDDAAAGLELLTRGNSGAMVPTADLLDEPVVRLALAGLLRRTGHPLEAADQEALVRTAHGVRELSFKRFNELPVGANVSSATLQLSRSGTATAQVETGAFRTTNLLVQATAAPALGQWPILSVSVGDREMTRLYLDGLQPRAYDLSLFPEGAPKFLKLGLSFLNDTYDPATRADRDIKLHFVAFH